MNKQIILQDNKITYILKKSKRAKRMRLMVYGNGSVVVTIPHAFQEIVAERFVIEKIKWISSKLTFFKQFESKVVIPYTHKDYLLHKENALILIGKKVKHFADIYGYTYNRISIKNQKTRWGSCSKKGNLNFNYKILFLPENTQDYIVAHELCHLKEFNHSKQFWNLLFKILPEYKESRRKLKEYSLVLR